MARGIKRVTCRHCGEHVDVCGPLSARGKCLACGLERLEASITEQANKEGDIYERWRAGIRRFAMRV